MLAAGTLCIVAKDALWPGSAAWLVEFGCLALLVVVAVASSAFAGRRLEDWRAWGVAAEEQRRLEREAAQARIAEHAAGEHALAGQLRQQAIVTEIGRLALGDCERTQLMQTACERLASALAIEHIQVFERQIDGRLLLRAGVGWPVGRIARATVGCGPGSIMALALASDEPVSFRDLRDGFPPEPLFDEQGIAAGVAVRLGTREEPFGVLSALTKTPRELTERELGGIIAIANLLSAAVQRKAAEEALRARQARLAAIVETATEGIITVDERGVIESFNPAAERLFGYSAGEVIGRNVRLLMPTPWTQQHDGYLASYLQTSEKKVIGVGRKVFGSRKDGASFPIELSVAEGKANGDRFFTGIVRDLSEREDMRAKLSQAERLAALGELAAGVAHEVNNPVSTMINCAQLLKDGVDDPGLCDDIIAEGERIAVIVRNLLKFARGESEDPQTAPVREALERTLSLVRRSIENQGIAIDLEVDPDLPSVLARPQQLQQVYLNILINARDALLDARNGELPKTIRIRGERVQSEGKVEVRLSFRDNGPGIPAELIGRIFEPFVTSKRASGGTGLGLSVSKRIVDDHHGSLQVASVPGEFTEFVLTLPAAS